MDYSDEQIRAYLLGNLSHEESELLEKEMEANAELAEAIDLQRDIMIGIRAAFDEKLKDKLSQVQDAGDNIRQLSPRALWRWASAAAIVLGTLGVYFYMNQTTLDERLYYTYYEDFPNIIEPTQRDQINSSPAFTAYQSEDWKEAEEAFDQLVIEQPSEVYPQFYSGIVAMNLEDWSKAISALEKVRASADERFVDPASWYVALAYLRNNNKERARLILEMIANTPGTYQEDARAILEELQ
ncbi:MAG: hypothetical protein HKN76_09660 [Saprospiraceae bacterium]|nr:hypothetical protein [Saprospiraceae bacterium]